MKMMIHEQIYLFGGGKHFQIHLTFWNSQSGQKKMYERPFTCKLKTPEKENFVEKPIQAPKCPSHGQSIKRCIKQVAESSGKAYTLEKREVFIRIQEAIEELFDKCC